GQPGTCMMYISTLMTPSRHGTLQNDFIIHEFTHGITNRLTGDGTGRCLQTTEAGGMGERWSDTMAEWTEHKDSTVPDYALATYVFNNHAGMRTRPYSTDASINPLRYSFIHQLHEVHVWTNMLHNVYAALVEVHGFSSTAVDDSPGMEGNIVWLHLFIDAISLHRYNPTREPVNRYDQNRYDGDNACTLWNIFSSRDLGMSAVNYVDDTSMLSRC
ncbi:peptidase M36, partial [Armillaria nabsnona]